MVRTSGRGRPQTRELKRLWSDFRVDSRAKQHRLVNGPATLLHHQGVQPVMVLLPYHRVDKKDTRIITGYYRDQCYHLQFKRIYGSHETRKTGETVNVVTQLAMVHGDYSPKEDC